MKKIFIILLILSCAVPVFAKKRVEETVITPLTQLEKRQFQTRSYKNEDKIVVMKALLNTLQDNGFVVYNANSLLGFVYGVKDFDTTDPNIDISKEFGFTKSRLNYNGVKVATLEANANITEYSDNVRIRINFKRKLLNEYGNAQFIDDVEEESFYEDFYEKMNNSMKLQKQVPVRKKIAPVRSTEHVIDDIVPLKDSKPSTIEAINNAEKKTIHVLNEEPKAIQQTIQQTPIENEKIKEEAKSVEIEEKTETEKETKTDTIKPVAQIHNENRTYEIFSDKDIKELEKQRRIQVKLLKQQEKLEAKNKVIKD